MIVTLTGPSCGGKSTLEKMLKARGFENAVSHTTRPMRAGEVDGENYHFIDKDEFMRLIRHGFFIEWVVFDENLYGISAHGIKNLLDKGKPVVLVCEPVGQRQVVNYCKTHGDMPILSVFVNNPNEVIAERFLRRMISDYTMVREEGQDALIARYASRMDQMMSVERDWVREAQLHHIYDLTVHAFDETNDEAVANMIALMAQARSKKEAA